MPSLDGDDKVVGFVAQETPRTGYYVRCYLVLDFSIHKLRMYPEEAELNPAQAECGTEINCQYITKVRASLTRPKALNSLEIVTTSGSHYLSVDSLEERDQWAESIKKASMRQGSAKQVASLMQAKQEKDASYRTKIVGGVVMKIPINESASKECAISSESKVTGAVSGATVGETRTRGFPRIIKAGHGTKLGHVRKNWKKRFFVLTELALAYYKTIDEVEPIKAVSVAEVSAVKLITDVGKELMEVVTPARTFQVQFDTAKELTDWVEAFTDLISSVKPQEPSQQMLATMSPATAMSSPSPTDSSSASLDSNELGTLV